MNKWESRDRKLRLRELELMVAVQTFGCEK